MDAAVAIALQLFISGLSGYISARSFRESCDGTGWTYLFCSAAWFAGAAEDFWSLP